MGAEDPQPLKQLQKEVDLDSRMVGIFAILSYAREEVFFIING